MTVEFNHETVMNMYKIKNKRFLTMTGHKGIAIAAEQIGKDNRQHWDTGASANAKSFNFVNDETIHINAGMEYDIYLERRFGIMKRMEDMLMPYMKQYEEICFG